MSKNAKWIRAGGVILRAEAVNFITRSDTEPDGKVVVYCQNSPPIECQVSLESLFETMDLKE